MVSLAEDDGAQRLSLVGHPIQKDVHEEQFEDTMTSASASASASSLQSPSGRRSAFWRGLFRRQSSNNMDEKNGNGHRPDDSTMNMEDSALLHSCPDLAYDSRRGDDEELDDYREEEDGQGGSSHRRRNLLAGGKAINESSSDEEQDDDDSGESDHGDLGSSTGHQLLFSTGEDDGDDDDDDNNDVDLINMHSSEPILRYNHKKVEHYSSANDDNEDDEHSGDDDSESGESGDEEESEEGEEEEDRVNGVDRDEQQPGRLPPLRNFFHRTQSMNSGSYSDNKDYSDDNSHSMVDSENRKNIHGRIEGFGSEPARTTEGPPERFTSARNLRERLRDFTSTYRMRKMNIGTEESLQRKTWVERFDNVVDSVLPADPELEGYIDAFQVRGKASVPMPHGLDEDVTPSRASRQREPPVINIRSPKIGLGEIMSHRRKRLGNIDDPSYIIFLECELQNRELELNSWKRRAAELEKEVKRLSGQEVEDDQDSESGDESSRGEQEDGESEIEWQTGVPEEGELIQVEEELEPKSLETSNDEEVEQEETSTFMMLHAPDSPNAGGGDDDFFPVLSSKSQRNEVESDWTESSPATPATITPKDTSSAFDGDSDGDDDVNKAVESDSRENGDDDDDDDYYCDEEEDDGASEESNEEKDDGTRTQFPLEGALIELDNLRTQDAKTAMTTETAVVVSDDDLSVNGDSREGNLLDLDS